ncbi:hypothetical protein BaRGS_00038211 [Batillaria attramentaria]|uniref:Protein-cysteine N-palmitoyltransferase Rasp n=1 Tax=Batillaria attramentaria TaxID=370345 RepID=A0ABD0J6S3_9CAEN
MNRRLPPPLPAWEQAMYWTCELFTLGYMMYSLYCASEDGWRKNEPLRIEEGWSFLNRPRDNADFEWEFWSDCFWKIFPWICGHVLISQALQLFSCDRNKRCLLLTLYGMWAISYFLGVRTVLFLCVQPVVLYVASMLGSSALVWIVSVAFLTLLNYADERTGQWLYRGDQSNTGNFHHWFYLYVFLWANMCQRATSFALECVWSKRKLNKHSSPSTEESNVEDKQTDGCENTGERSDRNQQLEQHTKVYSKQCDPWPTLDEFPGWVDMMFYMFYLPLFFTGPLIVYSNFHEQTRVPNRLTRQRLKDIILRLLRIMFWAILNNVLLHYFYAHAINSSTSVLKHQNRWTLAAVGYTLGQFFMTKYVVMFGLPAQVARLDGFEPPNVPACISYIYCYTDMWKSFDRGLYDFMKRYIFIPWGGSRAGFARQIQGSILCFVFVFYWHGAEYYLFLWCLFNFLEAILEQMGGLLEETAIVKRLIYSRLTPAGIRRIRAVMSVPVFLMSVFAIFYFFGGTDSGEIFLNKLLFNIPWDSFIVFMLLVYCAIQNAMEVERLGLAKLRNSK